LKVPDLVVSWKKRTGSEDSTSMNFFKAPSKLVREARPLVRLTETFGRASIAAAPNVSANALVIDARALATFTDLSWVHEVATKHSECASYKEAGGRIVILRRAHASLDPTAAACSEALIGFGKSIAQEVGGRGATVNVLCDASAADSRSEVCEAPLDWLLSHKSCYVTGQELVVVRPAPADTEAAASTAALVTGAARGIGRATAMHLRKLQPTRALVLVDHPSAAGPLAAIAAELGGTALPVDVTDTAAGATLAAAGATAGGFGAVIHAAGITRDKTLAKMDLKKQWQPVIDVNLRAVAALDEALLTTPGALAPLGAGFVSFGSTSGIHGNLGQSNYAAAKSGLMGYARAMGLAHEQRHRFACVAPGFIITEMTQKIPWLTRTIGAKLNSLGQGGLPEDVAAAVAFLASPAAAGLLPGTTLRVCGQFRGGR